MKCSNCGKDSEKDYIATGNSISGGFLVFCSRECYINKFRRLIEKYEKEIGWMKKELEDVVKKEVK